jgi:hypothetical protein
LTDADHSDKQETNLATSVAAWGGWSLAVMYPDSRRPLQERFTCSAPVLYHIRWKRQAALLRAKEMPGIAQCQAFLSSAQEASAIRKP